MGVSKVVGVPQTLPALLPLPGGGGVGSRRSCLAAPKIDPKNAQSTNQLYIYINMYYILYYTLYIYYIYNIIYIYILCIIYIIYIYIYYIIYMYNIL